MPNKQDLVDKSLQFSFVEEEILFSFFFALFFDSFRSLSSFSVLLPPFTFEGIEGLAFFAKGAECSCMLSQLRCT